MSFQDFLFWLHTKNLASTKTSQEWWRIHRKNDSMSWGERVLWEQAQSEKGSRVSGKGHGQVVSLRVRSRLWEWTQEGCVWKKRSWKVLNLKVRNLKFVYWTVKRYYYRHCPRRSPSHQPWGSPGLPSFSWIHSRDLPSRIPGLLPSSNICQGIYMQGLWACVLVLVSSLVGPWSRSHGEVLQRCNRHSLLAASECPSCVQGSGAPQGGV